MDYLSVRLSMHKKDNEEDLKVFFEVIKKNAERLIRLVNNVLDYERIELGELEMHFKEINLKNVFDEVITGFRPMSENKKVSIELSAEDVMVHADEDRIKQALTNLLSNALNFSPESSNIIVTLTEADGYANASVEDSGCGIAKGEKEMIFRQFYSKGIKNGTGLGLAICKGIIEAHNGEIGVRTIEGKGSRFWFTIPKTRKEAFLNEKTPACSR
jgi:signal transduction histidine kinase